MTLLSLAAAAVATIGAGSAHAEILTSFEDGVDGFSGGSTTLSVGTEGVTHGTQSLQVTGTTFNWIVADGFDNAAQEAFAEALTGEGMIYLDVTLPEDEDEVGNADVGWWMNLGAVFNDADGWRQGPAISIPQDPVQGKILPGTYTVGLDISGLADPNYAEGTWFQWGFSVNWDSNQANADPTGVAYIDAIRTTEAIPEPASLSLLGAAGLMALRRRRA